MSKIVRNMSTPESRAFWEQVDRAAREVEQWPEWQKGWIDIPDTRREPRVAPEPVAAEPPSRPST